MDGVASGLQGNSSTFNKFEFDSLIKNISSDTSSSIDSSSVTSSSSDKMEKTIYVDENQFDEVCAILDFFKYVQYFVCAIPEYPKYPVSAILDFSKYPKVSMYPCVARTAASPRPCVATATLCSSVRGYTYSKGSARHGAPSASVCSGTVGLAHCTRRGCGYVVSFSAT